MKKLLAIILSLTIFIFTGITAQAHAGDCKLHFLTLKANTLSVLVESNGKFGMIDSGEDRDFPDGNDSRYPNRYGITKTFGFETEVIDYLKSVGVNKDNFEFYIGTHPHSDHIGSADEIINEFHPKRVYTPEYKDSMIKNPNGLWDNIYIYDNMLEAAINNDASIITGFSDFAPLYPERVKAEGKALLKDTYSDSYLVIENETHREIKEKLIFDDKGESNISVELPKFDDNKNEHIYNVSIRNSLGTKIPEDKIELNFNIVEVKPLDITLETSDGRFANLSKSRNTVACPKFKFGSMEVEILNTNKKYDENNQAPDANCISFGVLLTANNKKAFISGDINNFTGDETSLIPKLGKIDLLSLGHHGFYGSNTYDYMKAIDPEIIVIPGDYTAVHNTANYLSSVGELDMLLEFGKKGTTVYPTALFNDKYKALVFDFNKNLNSNIKSTDFYVASPRIDKALYYENGLPTVKYGIVDFNGSRYFFNHSYYSTVNSWVNYKGKKYYAGKDKGKLLKYWNTIDGNRYYMNSLGAVMTGWLQVISTKKWYYLDRDGKMCTGFKDIEGERYYFDKSGVMLTGWAQINGNWYLFNSAGHMIKGWHSIGSVQYYFDNSGKLAIGFKEIDGYTYYFDQNGHMLKGTQIIDGEKYMFTEDGKLLSGWQEINGIWYYMDNTGKVKTGWQKINYLTYYFSTEGEMVTGFKRIDGIVYYFARSGFLVFPFRR